MGPEPARDLSSAKIAASFAVGKTTRGEHVLTILCLGGGPAGLYFAISAKLRDASYEVEVVERNRASDSFG